MAKLSKLDYEVLKSTDPADLDQEMLDAIHEYESSEAGVPTKEEMDYATTILNESNPLIQKAYRDNGDLEKANKIISQSRAAKELMIKQGKDPYVKQVKRVPDDINKDYGFKFNWKSAYENATGEKLRPTENDAKKLEKFVGENLYAIDDPVKLQKIAYDMHLFNPNTMTWSEFIKSDNGKEFQNYLQDVQKAQKDKRLDEIWNNESNMAVDFMLPVSKEYARKNYENINGVGDMAKPLATDALANAAMMMGGESLPMKIASMGTAPLITEAGNVALNDKPLKNAAANALESGLVNMATPFMLGRGANMFSRGIGNSEKNIARDIMNNAANASDKVKREIRNGKPYEIDGDWFKENRKGRLTAIYTDHPEKFTNAEQKLIKPLDELPNEGVSTIERENARNWEQFRRGLSNDEQARANLDRSLEDIMYGIDRNSLQARKLASIRNKGNISELSPSDIKKLGIRDKETITNYIVRNIRNKTPEEAKNYIQNLAGRDKSARAYGSWLNNIFGTDLFRGESKKQDTNKLIKLYGLDQD